MVTPASTSPEVTEGKEYVFRSCFTDAQQGEAAARFVHDELKKSKAAIVYLAQDGYSAGLAQSFRAGFTRLGGQIVFDKGHAAHETNFKPLLSAAKAQNPEVIFAPVYYAEMVNVARQAKELAIPGALFFGGDAWDSALLLKGAGAELEGAFFTDHYVAGVPWESSQSFLRNFRAKFGRDPGSIAAQGYDAAKLLFDAIARAQEPTPEAIKGALADTKGFVGATGGVTMDKGHNAQKPVVIVEIKGKKFTYRAQIAPE
jgi:branched-chain amino acid transport system substrate-binding protein